MRKGNMRKKFLAFTLAIALLVPCAVWFTACNKESSRPLNLEEGSRPLSPSLFAAEDIELIRAAMAEDASEDVKKKAVNRMFKIANKSRINTPLSLMVQNSDVGMDKKLATVTMHAFNLKQGDAWYYQLATDVFASNKFVAALMSEFAGFLKVAYTTGDGDFYYAMVQGPDSECDCSIDVFPYAEFKLTKPFDKMNEEQFQERLHYLLSMHEINNLAFCAEIIADGAVIEYNSEKGYYTVTFEIDTDADGELLQQWYAMAQKDMQVSGQSIEKYNSYKATLQVWDNGYAKSFYSEADRSAGVASGKPVDEFKYFWVKEEIMALLAQDTRVEDHEIMNEPIDYIAFYSDTEIVGAKLSALKIAGIVIGCVIAAIIITVIVIEVLVRCGKLPKLAEKRERKKLKRREKRAAKKGLPLDDEEKSEYAFENVFCVYDSEDEK